MLAKRSFKLDKMDLSALLQLRDEVESALNGKIAMERRELQSKLAEMDRLERRPLTKAPASTRKAGGRRTATGAGKTRTPVAPKYRGPGGETWAGRGLAPKWLTELEKKGKKREQFLIAKV